ncbi:hypothetical protein QBC39DRAFT_340722 [Podospora conica]|nr:hypothetical protein QBC39DRAFT_340722 [Schizothecium conicum]
MIAAVVLDGYCALIYYRENNISKVQGRRLGPRGEGSGPSPIHPLISILHACPRRGHGRRAALHCACLSVCLSAPPSAWSSIVALIPSLALGVILLVVVSWLPGFRRLHFALSAPVSCWPAPAPIFIFSHVHSLVRQAGTRTQATEKRVSVRVAPSSTGESLFSSFISSHASHLFTDSTLHAPPANQLGLYPAASQATGDRRQATRRPSVSTDPAGAQLQTACHLPPPTYHLNSTNPHPLAARRPPPARRGP